MERWSRRDILRGAAALGVSCSLPRWSHAASAENGVRVGMTTALTGPARALGIGMKTGIESFFATVNAAGGIHGRTLELVALDDGYEPGRAGPNMRKLCDDGVMAVLGNAGTPTAAVTAPIANEKRVPLVGAFTGAGLLRKTPPDRYVVNYRASYAQETAEMVRGVVDELGVHPRHIGFFTQNDAYGDSGYNGGIAALEALGFTEGAKLPHGRYPRNTVFVEDGLSRLMDPREDVRAVIMVGAYRPCGRFIQLARANDFHALCMNVSFVGSGALANVLGEDRDGVVVTQVVPHPQGDLPVCEEFRRVLPPERQDFVALEGFLVAKAFCAGLAIAGPGAGTETWIDAMESGAELDLGLGRAVSLTKDRHQLSDTIWPTVLRNGRFEALDDWKLLGRPA